MPVTSDPCSPDYNNPQAPLLLSPTPSSSTVSVPTCSSCALTSNLAPTIAAHSPSVLLVVTHSNPENKVDNYRCKQRERKNRRAEPIVKAALAPHPYAFRAPVECEQRIHHGHHSDQGEQPRANLSDLVTKVEKPNGQAAQDDGEVQP